MIMFWKRYLIVVISGLLGLSGWAAHAYTVLNLTVWNGQTWVAIGAAIKVGDFTAAAALGTVSVIWLAVTMICGVIAIAIFVRPWHDMGKAGWGGMADAKAAGLLGKTGFILGVFKGRLLRQSALSTLVFGPTRTGKSVGVIIPSILGLGKISAFVHDLKGELCEHTAGTREKVGRVVVVNPRSSATARWNPIARDELPADPSDRGDLVDSYWQFLIPQSTVSSDTSKHFTDGGRVFGAAATLLLIYRAEAEKRDATMAEVLEWLTGVSAAVSEDEGEAGRAVEELYQQVSDAIEEVRSAGWPRRIEIGLARILRAAKEERSSLVSTAVGGLTPWLNEKIASTSSACDFSVRDYRSEKPLTVYWVAPPMDAKTYGPLTGMHIEALVRFLTLEYREGLPLVALVVDEAAVLPALNVVAEAPAIVLGYGVRLLVAIQDVSQLVMKYGQTRYDAMIGHYGSKVVFAQNSLKTAKEISEIIGKTTRLVSTGSARDSNLADHSESVRSDGKNLIEPSDIMSLKRGELIVLSQYHTQRPLKVKSAYFKEIGWMRRAASVKPSKAVAAALRSS